eukprot:2655376-Rhodomonas_salina.1
MDAVSVSFSSCAEALSTQVYHKMYLPGTDRTEEGWVGGEDFSQKVAPRHPIYSLVVDLTKDPPEHFSYTTSCSTLVPETQEVPTALVQIRLCNGWASRTTDELIADPEPV